MRKLGIICGVMVMTMTMGLTGCGKAAKEDVATIETQTILSEDVVNALEELDAIAINYSKGIAPLNIIPSTTVELVYDNWDAIQTIGNEHAPVLLREYVDPNMVYLDYNVDYSIKWLKDSGDVQVEKTDVEARESYKEKAHK